MACIPYQMVKFKKNLLYSYDTFQPEMSVYFSDNLKYKLGNEYSNFCIKSSWIKNFRFDSLSHFGFMRPSIKILASRKIINNSSDESSGDEKEVEYYYDKDLDDFKSSISSLEDIILTKKEDFIDNIPNSKSFKKKCINTSAIKKNFIIFNFQTSFTVSSFGKNINILLVEIFENGSEEIQHNGIIGEESLESFLNESIIKLYVHPCNVKLFNNKNGGITGYGINYQIVRIDYLKCNNYKLNDYTNLQKIDKILEKITTIQECTYHNSIHHVKKVDSSFGKPISEDKGFNCMICYENYLKPKWGCDRCICKICNDCYFSICNNIRLKSTSNNIEFKCPYCRKIKKLIY